MNIASYHVISNPQVLSMIVVLFFSLFIQSCSSGTAGTVTEHGTFNGGQYSGTNFRIKYFISHLLLL